jgi:hypothetical protein
MSVSRTRKLVESAATSSDVVKCTMGREGVSIVAPPSRAEGAADDPAAVSARDDPDPAGRYLDTGLGRP